MAETNALNNGEKMKTIDKLILLADKLDREGLDKDAALIDNMIIKKSEDQETGEMKESVMDLLSTEIKFVRDLIAMNASFDQQTGEFDSLYINKKDYETLMEMFSGIDEKLMTLSELDQELKFPEEDTSQEGPEAPEQPETPEEDSGEKEERWPFSWWKNRGKDSEPDPPSEEPPEELPELSPEEPDDVEIYEEFDGDLPGDQRRAVNTRGGVSVEQNLSNVGNITIE